MSQESYIYLQPLSIEIDGNNSETLRKGFSMVYVFIQARTYCACGLES